MSFELHSGRRNRPWREFLTATEVEKLAEIDAEIAVVDSRRRELSRQRREIANRATQRAGYHARASA